MAEGKTPGNASTSPFGNGQGATQASGAASGGHNFLTDNSSPPGGQGRDFTKESRPQSEAKDENQPNSAEIPAGGKLMKADPGPVSSKIAGDAKGIAPAKPYRVKG